MYGELSLIPARSKWLLRGDGRESVRYCRPSSRFGMAHLHDKSGRRARFLERTSDFLYGILPTRVECRLGEVHWTILGCSAGVVKRVKPYIPFHFKVKHGTTLQYIKEPSEDS